MKRHFNIVHFVPDPISGARVPMGAVVHEGQSFRIAVAEHLPGPDCLGGEKTARLLNLLIDDLHKLRRPEEIYQALGPQILVDESNSVPAEVDDAVSWVKRFILPSRPTTPTKSSGVRRPSRYIEGKRFLETQGVGKYVRRSFKPQKFLKTTNDQISHLYPISQWVKGTRELLLMEPLIPRRPSWEKELTEINTRLSAYRYHVQNGLNGHRSETYVYILPGGDPDKRQQIRQTLEKAADVIDSENSSQLAEFVERVREVGDTQMELGR